MSLHRLVIALFLLQLSDSFSLPAKEKGKQIKELATFLLCHPKKTTECNNKEEQMYTRSLAPNSNKKMHTIFDKLSGKFFHLLVLTIGESKVSCPAVCGSKNSLALGLSAEY